MKVVKSDFCNCRASCLIGILCCKITMSDVLRLRVSSTNFAACGNSPRCLCFEDVRETKFAVV